MRAGVERCAPCGQGKYNTDLYWRQRLFLQHKTHPFSPHPQPLPLPDGAHPASSGDTFCSALSVFCFASNVLVRSRTSSGRRANALAPRLFAENRFGRLNRVQSMYNQWHYDFASQFLFRPQEQSAPGTHRWALQQHCETGEVRHRLCIDAPTFYSFSDLL